MTTLDTLTLSRDAIDALNRTQDQARIAELEAKLAEVIEDRGNVTIQRTEALRRLDEYIELDAKMGATILQLRSEVERYKTALLELLPGLSIDLRYAHLDDDADVDALRSRVETIHRALKEPIRG